MAVWPDRDEVSDLLFSATRDTWWYNLVRTEVVYHRPRRGEYFVLNHCEHQSRPGPGFKPPPCPPPPIMEWPAPSPLPFVFVELAATKDACVEYAGGKWYNTLLRYSDLIDAEQWAKELKVLLVHEQAAQRSRRQLQQQAISHGFATQTTGGLERKLTLRKSDAGRDEQSAGGSHLRERNQAILGMDRRYCATAVISKKRVLQQPKTSSTSGSPSNVNAVEEVRLIFVKYREVLRIFQGNCPHRGRFLGDGELIEIEDLSLPNSFRLGGFSTALSSKKPLMRQYYDLSGGIGMGARANEESEDEEIFKTGQHKLLGPRLSFLESSGTTAGGTSTEMGGGSGPLSVSTTASSNVFRPRMDDAVVETESSCKGAAGPPPRPLLRRHYTSSSDPTKNPGLRRRCISPQQALLAGNEPEPPRSEKRRKRSDEVERNLKAHLSTMSVASVASQSLSDETGVIYSPTDIWSMGPKPLPTDLAMQYEEGRKLTLDKGMRNS